MGEERCDHGLIIGQCSDCKPAPEGLKAQVWITKGGSVFHRTPGCEALADGQDRAARLGLELHQPTLVSLTEAMAQGRGACIPCFPKYRPNATTSGSD
ncbi:hypothetical protein ACWC9T_13125 [Kitasatospora sp. NPDC001159]